MVPNANGQLVSWKEISSYLGIDERTCQRWEKKYGLPIRRIDAARKSRVFAYKTELDDWRNKMSEPNGSFREPSAEVRPSSAVHRSSRSLILWGVGVLGLLGGLLALILIRPFADRTPFDFRIEGSRLVITAPSGRTLWSFETKLENLQNEAYYRDRFQKDSVVTDEVKAWTHEPLLLIKDFDRDGRREVLFAPATTDDLKAGQLMLFNDRGERRWTHLPPPPIRIGSQEFPGEYVTSFVEGRDLDGDGRLEIVWSLHSRGEFPTLTILLDPADRVLGEYWNAGQFNEVDFADLNGDRREEIILAGQNNEYGRPCLVVLSAGNMKGGSPQSPAFRFAGVDSGQELFYILFPLTAVDTLSAPGITFDLLVVLDDGTLQLTSSVSGIQYDFDISLHLIKATATHNFERIYNERVREGRIRESFQKEKIESELRAAIRYLDGRTGQWTDRVAMSHGW
jgi:hypothetical protein